MTRAAVLIAATLAAQVLGGCLYGTSRPAEREVAPGLLGTAEADDLSVADALEGLIVEGRASTADREWAYYELAHRGPPASAAAAFARAATAGRVAQLKGLNAGALVEEVERYGRLSRALDPEFRRGAAQRMLATLYVMAPSAMVRHGDSETGVELLEELVARYPEDLENPLRLAEALLTLGDRESALPHLCRASAGRDLLRRDDRALLEQLIEEAGRPPCATLAGPHG